jgi:hypothetical protein
MENQTSNQSSKLILFIIAIGIWAIVLQNAGVIPTSQNVNVVNSVDVDGSVRVSGNVNVDNTVDINIEEINGKSNAFYDHNFDKNYNRIPVYMGN